MADITGIELGSDSCVLMRVRQDAGATEVSAIHVVNAAEWPPQHVALAALLRHIRREKQLPRRARVVAWQMSESASSSDPAVRAAVRPLIEAGFRIDALVSPPQALATLAASRRAHGDAATAWLALNRQAAAIAIVRGTELLFSRVFGWSYRGTGGSAKAQLLERYSLVAHLAPELRRGMDVVRANHRTEVGSAIACGDLPDLRSFTLPLSEELNLQVDTLDSTDGLVLTPAAREQRAAELAPALRLASAAAVGASRDRRQMPSWLQAAAAVVLVAGAAAVGYSRWPARPRATQGPPAVQQPVRQPRVADTATSQPKPQEPTTTEPARAQQKPEQPKAAAPVPSQPSAQQPKAAAPLPSPPQQTKSASPAPAQGRQQAPPRAQASAPAQSEPRAPTRTASQSPRVTPPPPPSRPSTPTVSPTAPKPDDRTADTTRAQTPGAPPRPRPLNAPVPNVSSILISSERRVAVIDGETVGVGEQVGPRVVARIESSFVVLREPSGLEIKVPLR
jgi:hypothetical protein